MKLKKTLYLNRKKNIYKGSTGLFDFSFVPLYVFTTTVSNIDVLKVCRLAIAEILCR